MSEIDIKAEELVDKAREFLLQATNSNGILKARRLKPKNIQIEEVKEPENDTTDRKLDLRNVVRLLNIYSKDS